MTGTTVGIILIVVAIIITNLTLLIQVKKIYELREKLKVLEVAFLTKAMMEMGIETLEDLEVFLKEEIEKEE